MSQGDTAGLEGKGRVDGLGDSGGDGDLEGRGGAGATEDKDGPRGSAEPGGAEEMEVWAEPEARNPMVEPA